MTDRELIETFLRECYRNIPEDRRAELVGTRTEEDDLQIGIQEISDNPRDKAAILCIMKSETPSPELQGKVYTWLKVMRGAD